MMGVNLKIYCARTDKFTAKYGVMHKVVAEHEKTGVKMWLLGSVMRVLLPIQRVEVNPGPKAVIIKTDQILTYVIHLVTESKVIKRLLRKHTNAIMGIKQKVNTVGSKFGMLTL
jgi:hypothetical protein